MRPYVVCAYLQNIHFTAESYASFIDLQEKLHQNICRKRTLVAIGTHDADTVEGPFTYEALPPNEIRFCPLNQTKEMNGEELVEFYRVSRTTSRVLAVMELLTSLILYVVKVQNYHHQFSFSMLSLV